MTKKDDEDNIDVSLIRIQVKRNDFKNNDSNESSDSEKSDLSKKERNIEFFKIMKTFLCKDIDLHEYIGYEKGLLFYKRKSLNFRRKYSNAFKKNFIKRKENNNNELIISRKLKQTNILSNHSMLYNNYDNNKISFYISKFGKYGNLNDFMRIYLKKSNLSETFLNYLAKPILEALNNLYKLKLFIVDLSEKNIIFDSDFDAKLVYKSQSFSFENYEPNELIKLPITGRLKYLPLEVINKEEIEIKYLDKIYSYFLGVFLYNLAFKCYPYGLNNINENDYEKIAELINKTKLEFPLSFKVSTKFTDFLKKVLDRDYKERYNIKEALEDTWIKGWDYIMEEKDNIDIDEDLKYFLIKLIFNNIPKFNQYLKSDT